MTTPGWLAALVEALGPVGSAAAFVIVSGVPAYIALRKFALERQKADTDEGRAFRDELREELKRVKGEVADLRAELDRTFEKYLAARHDANNLSFKVKSLEAELARREARIAELTAQLAEAAR